MRRTPAARAASNDNLAHDVRLNQYYTQPKVARRLYRVFCGYFDPRAFLMVEPSAGTGAFFRLLPPGSRAFDLDPRIPGIETKDFLDVTIGGERLVAFIGNPPFSGGMAARFFNHAAWQAEVVALILPRSFRKDSKQDQLNSDFHLLHDENVEKNAFLFRGKPFDVPAVFQIWVRRPVARAPHARPTTHPDFEFLRTKDGADFAMQRVGANAGQICDLTEERKAHYFIRANRSDVRSVLESLDYSEVKGNVAAKPSIAKSEIIELYVAWRAAESDAA